ncbi:MAG: hypothetical protein AAF098_04815 [Pseudomonadota bacterium]
MRLFNTLRFVRDELQKLPDLTSKPSGGLSYFCDRIGRALALIRLEKEILVFAALQWLFISLGYLLWIQMLDWIPDEVWRSAANSRRGSIVDVVLTIWSFFVVGLVAFPVGLLSGCIGATHFLHRQDMPATVTTSVNVVLPSVWSLWLFHWVDGWITVKQILERLPKKRRRSPMRRLASETAYYAWKLGVSGVLPSLVTGSNLVRSGKNSVRFVKENLSDVAKLRLGYSALCWLVGVTTYLCTAVMFSIVDVVPEKDAVYRYVYDAYLWAALPICVAVAIVSVLLRPVYLIALCELYADHLATRGINPNAPDSPSKLRSAMIAFVALITILAAVYGFRDELGVTALLSTPYPSTQ